MLVNALSLWLRFYDLVITELHTRRHAKRSASKDQRRGWITILGWIRLMSTPVLTNS